MVERKKEWWKGFVSNDGFDFLMDQLVGGKEGLFEWLHVGNIGDPMVLNGFSES